MDKELKFQEESIYKKLHLTLSETKKLIISAFPGEKSIQKWADLGCGNGLFANALSEFLKEGSKIFAIDKDSQIIQPVNSKVEIKFMRNNFENGIAGIENLDGILMANSLHYVQNKEKLIQNLLQHLKPDGKFIIIEYDTKNANPWIPFPVDFDGLKQLFAVFGYNEIKIAGERRSIYGNDKMFAAVIEKTKPIKNK